MDDSDNSNDSDNSGNSGNSDNSGDLDIFDYSKQILYGLLVYLIIKLIWNIIRLNWRQVIIYLIYITIIYISMNYFNDKIEENEDPICKGFIMNIDKYNSKYRDSEHEGEDTLFTAKDMKLTELSYTCRCNESKGLFLRPKNRPENKKSKWRDSSGNIGDEKTYMEEYGDLCNDVNKCKVEDRPLERCTSDESCHYPGMICYKHPSFTNGERNDVSPGLKGVCILESHIYQLEGLIDNYNMAYCDPKSDGGIDYNCTTTWDTRENHVFINSERDILGNSVLGSLDDISICYHPANEKRTVTSYDEDNHKYIDGPGSVCCVPKIVPDNHQQADSLLESLSKNPEIIVEELGMMIFFDVIENLSVLAIRTGWKMLRNTGMSFSEAFSEVAGKRNYIAKALKGTVSATIDVIKGLIRIKDHGKPAVELAKLLKNLASRFKNGLKALNDMRKAAATAIERGVSAVEGAVSRAATTAVTEAAEAGAGGIAAAGAEAAGEQALAKLGEDVALKTAGKASTRFLNAIPGIGQVLLAVQLIGMVMDETGYGGYENIIKNRELIETLSEQKEAQFLKTMEHLDQYPPYSANFVDTFFSDDNHNEGSTWPFNMDEVDSSDKKDCELLLNMIKFQKQKNDVIIQEMFASQIQMFLDSFNDDEFSENIMNELSEIVQGDDSNIENNLGDYFTEYLLNYVHYHYTKQDAEERDQKIYDYILSKTNLVNDSKYKSVTNTGVYYNDDALIYLNKELSSEKYSGILFTKKAVDLYNRYRNLREGQQYVVFSKYYFDIAYIEQNTDYPNNEKYHLKKMNIKESILFKRDPEFNFSRDNPILTKGMAQITQMNDLVNVCQYGIKLGKANYFPSGLHGVYHQLRDEPGVHGQDLWKTWLKGGENPETEQPFGYPNLEGARSCRENCQENHGAEDATEEQAKIRLENYNNRVMSWNYADKSGSGENWSGLNEFNPKNSSLIANYQGVTGPHDEVIDHDNRICHITATYCERAGHLDRRFNNPYGGDHSNTLNHFEQPYGSNHREYNDCEASTGHVAAAFIFGDSLTNTVARWF